MNALDGASSLHFVTEQVTPCLLGINGKAGSRSLRERPGLPCAGHSQSQLPPMDPSQDMADPSAKTVALWGNTFQKEQGKPESGGKK